MLLLALLLPPLALYLLVLGWINRRPRPVMMGGPWEFAGVLFALSGVLLVGGPALLTSLDEQSRWFWLLGETEAARPSSAGAETQLGRPTPTELGATQPARAPSSVGWAATTGIVVRLLYFAVVALGAALLLWASRRLTSIYNVDTRAIFTALEQAFQRLGLTARRTGQSFHIDARPPEAAAKEGKNEAAPGTALHVDIFAAMRHVTLRWDPSASPVRREMEQELTQTLAEVAPPEPEAVQSGCLTLAGVVLFALALVAGGLLILFHFYPPR